MEVSMTQVIDTELTSSILASIMRFRHYLFNTQQFSEMTSVDTALVLAIDLSGGPLHYELPNKEAIALLEERNACNPDDQVIVVEWMALLMAKVSLAKISAEH